MTAVLIATLFAAAGFFALAAIGLDLGNYRSALRGLRTELAQCMDTREVRYTLITTVVHSGDKAAYGRRFMPGTSAALFRPELRAAA